MMKRTVRLALVLTHAFCGAAALCVVEGAGRPVPREALKARR